VDALCILYVTSKFAADVKKANKIINEIKNIGSNEVINPEILRDQLKKDIFGLSATFINGFIGKIKTQKEIDDAINTLREVEIYIKDNEDKIKSTTALTKAALKEGWKLSKKKQGEESRVESVGDVESKDEKRVFNSENEAVWLKIKEFINSEFLSEELQQEILPKLQIYSLKEDEIILSTDDKFVRDWVISNFADETNNKNLAAIINKIYPNKKLNVIYVSE
jgi:multidrug efflux pump subunit AcrB